MIRFHRSIKLFPGLRLYVGKRGRIKRNPEAKRTFKMSHPCPSTGRSSGACPGYVVDHIKPLKRGGADSPSNMQWQTKAEAKAKDRVED
jgi:hypothetical protein